MPYTVSEHQETKVIDLSDFTGGLRLGIPPTHMEDNECELLENFYIDPLNGRPRTRYPVVPYSTAAANAAINGIYVWNNFWFITTTSGTMYYLDDNRAPQSLGTLNGSERPVFAPFHDKLIVASGGDIQYTAIAGVPSALANVSGGVTASAVFERYTRLVAVGDPDYPDRVYESAFENETDWTSSDYADVGYLDGLQICGITEAFEGLYIVFKRGKSGMKTYYLTSLSSTNPQANLAADGHSIASQGGIVPAIGKVFLMEDNYISVLDGTERQGKIFYDPTPGMKIQTAVRATSAGFGVLYPRDFQIWFVPDPSVYEVYVYHYLRNAWSIFKFPDRIYSAFYNPSDGYLYLGASDGYVYKYHRGSMLYKDLDSNGTTYSSYTQRLRTKMFYTGNREVVLKSPMLHWYYLYAGSGTLYVYFDYGASNQLWGTLTLTDGHIDVYDTGTVAEGGSGVDTTYVYSTGTTTEGGSGADITYVYPGSEHEYHRGDYAKASDTYQFDITLTSGAFRFDRIVGEVSAGRRS